MRAGWLWVLAVTGCELLSAQVLNPANAIDLSEDGPKVQYTFTFRDPHGNSAAGMEARVFGKRLGTGPPDSRGVNETLFERELIISKVLDGSGVVAFSHALRGWHDSLGVEGLEVQVLEPTTGQREVFEPQTTAWREYPPKLTIPVFLENNAAGPTAIAGQIVGEDQQGTSGVYLKMERAVLSADTWVSFSGSVAVFPGFDGRFSLGIPAEQLKPQSGLSAMPSGGYVEVTTHSLEELDHVSNGGGPYGDYAYKLRVGGFNTVNYQRGSEESKREAAPLGSAEVGTSLTVSGRVVDAVTGDPIAGAYVLSASDSAWKLSQMPEKERDNLFRRHASLDTTEILKLSPNIDINDVMIYDLLATERTDKEGRFAFILPNRNWDETVKIWAPGRIPVSTFLSTVNYQFGCETTMPKRQYDFALRDAELLPAATVFVAVNPPARIPEWFVSGESQQREVGFVTGVTFEKPFGWKLHTNDKIATDGLGSLWCPEFSGGWHRFGERSKVLVPAGVAITTVTQAADIRSTLDKATWVISGPMKPGETRELEAKTIGVAHPIRIVVKTANGRTVAGKTVRVFQDGAYSLPLITDEQGATTFWNRGLVVESVAVYADSEGMPEMERRDIPIPSQPEPALVEVTLPAPGVGTR